MWNWTWILSFVVIINSVSIAVTEQLTEEFCKNLYIEGVFNRGSDIYLKVGHNVWIFNEKQQKITALVSDQTIAQKNGYGILAQLMFERFPECNPKVDGCQRFLKAQHMIFLRIISFADNSQSTSVIKFNGSSFQEVDRVDYPWNLENASDVWPQEWNQSEQPLCPITFNPKDNAVLSIVYTGKPNAEIIASEILPESGNDWFKIGNHQIRHRIISDVTFVGMFFSYNKGIVYAIGHQTNSEFKQSSIYQLMFNKANNKADRRFWFQLTEKDFRVFFKCHKQADDNNFVLIIVTIIIIFLIAFLAFGLIFVLIACIGKSQALKPQLAKPETSKSNRGLVLSNNR